jgi:hypothetical protein
LDPEEEAATADGVPAAVARLEMFRLTREEMAFQPVPMLPGLARLTAAVLDGVPRLRQSGPFSAFTVPAAASDQQWVVRASTCHLYNYCFYVLFLPKEAMCACRQAAGAIHHNSTHLSLKSSIV